jgi:hypothetical protein
VFNHINQAYQAYNLTMKPEVADTDYLLTANDRCDACQAQAYVHVELESGDLLFCLHHWKKHFNKLVIIATSFTDETERLLGATGKD